MPRSLETPLRGSKSTINLQRQNGGVGEKENSLQTAFPREVRLLSQVIRIDIGSDAINDKIRRSLEGLMQWTVGD